MSKLVILVSVSLTAACVIPIKALPTPESEGGVQNDVLLTNPPFEGGIPIVGDATSSAAIAPSTPVLDDASAAAFAATCTATNLSCTSSEQCCSFQIANGYCTDFPKLGVFCADLCVLNADCASGCCVQAAFHNVCGLAGWCQVQGDAGADAQQPGDATIDH
jgi:hypothetical protein